MPNPRDEIPRTSMPLAARMAIGVAMLAVGGAAAWWLSGGGTPAPPAPLQPEDPTVTEAILALRAESLELEEAFDDEVAEGEVPHALLLRGLEDAVRAQKDFLRLHPSPAWADRERERVLDIKLATMQGRVKLAESEQFERQATDLLSAGDRAGAVAALQEALRLQREINSSAADTTVRRTAREAELAARLDHIEAEPLAQAAERFEADAQLALSTGDAGEAARLYQEAANLQRRINQLYGRTRFASTARLDRLVAEIASLGAVGLAAERDRAIDQGALRDRVGAATEAAALFAHARDLQAQINREFAQSRFASAARWDELEVMRQTAASRPLVAALAAQEEQLAATLRARRADPARDLVERGAADAAALASEFPRSRLLAPGWRERIDYLKSLAPRIELIHGEVFDHLRPVPETTVQMLAHEVPQGLYSTVMGDNPSRVQGNRLPAESLTGVEAQEFCRRLSWILGRAVRLPTRAEFSAALAATGGDACTAENAGGLPRAVEAGAANAAGFRDLRGNVAEWVTGENGEGLLTGGGSYADPVPAPGEPLFRGTAQTERFRTVGFRVVVE